MAFKFSLEQVLKYRTQLEQKAKAHFATVESERIKAQQKFDELTASLIEQQAQLTALTGDIDSRWLIESFIKGLKVDLRTASDWLKHWDKEVEKARIELTEKAKEKKILEKLKEKQEQKYVHEEKLNEQKFFDELTAGKEARNC